MQKLFTTAIIILATNLSAQNTLTGKVVDSKKVGLPFVNITLQKPSSSTVIKGTTSNDAGLFEIEGLEKGNYILIISFLGYRTIERPLEMNASIHLGDFILEEEFEALNEVTLVGRKKLIERKIDRLVFNVENSSKSSEGDALQVLTVTPGIRVQNDRISMIGKNTLAVMVNDKIIRLSGEDLSNFLKSIASEDIKNIEVITTPPAKYEATGNSGMVNIKLKRARQDSWNALFRGNYWQRTFPNVSTGGNFNYNKGKLSIASSAFYRTGLYFQEQDDFAFFPDALWYTSSPFEANTEGLNGRVDLNYQLTNNVSIGAQYLFNRTAYDVTDSPFTPVTANNTGEIIQSLQSEGTMDLSPTINAANINSVIQLDTIGKKATVNIDYFTYRNPDTKTYSGIFDIVNPSSQQFYAGVNTNEQDVTNISGTLDFEYPTNWGSLSFGGKITQSKSLNNITFFNSGFVDNPVTDFPLDSNDFEYIENIQALYISSSKSLGEKWEAQLGFRFEATQTESLSSNLNLKETNDYIKLFPTFYLSHNPNENNSLVFSYSKRIDRPQFFDLNPNIYFINPFQTIEGNPFLQPSFVDNFELSHTYKNLSSKVYYSDERDIFAQVPLPDASTNSIRFTNENYINTQRFGFSTSFMFNKWNWWTSNSSFDINFSRSQFDLDTPQDDLSGLNSRISTNNDFVLNENKTLLTGINYWYSFPGVDGIFETESISSLYLSLQYLMLDKNLRFSVRGNDIFRTQATRQSTTVNGVFQEARYYYDSQSLIVSISYKFGNNDISAKRHRTGNQSERSRTGN